MKVTEMYKRCAIGIAAGMLLLLQTSVAQTKTESAIDRATAYVNTYLNELADVTCTEEVSQEKLTPKGKMELHESATYDYLIMMDGSQDQFTLNESRLLKTSDHPKKNLPMLVTNGFSTLFLIFHPYYRDGFALTDEGNVVENGRQLARIHFSHIRGKRTPIALAVQGREYPLEFEGTAWVDAQTGGIVRISAGLSEPMDDIGLRTLNMQVNYSAMKVAGSDQSYFYPQSAYVEVETKKQRWRNIHVFSNYKRFGVSTSSEVAATGKKE